MRETNGRDFALGIIFLCVLALPFLCACGNDGDAKASSPATPGGTASQTLEWGTATWGASEWTKK